MFGQIANISSHYVVTFFFFLAFLISQETTFMNYLI